LSAKPRLWPVLLATVLGLAILCGLGTWQLKRLAWKNALIATLTDRMEQDPVPLAEALKRLEDNQDIEYTKVYATGELNAAYTLYKQTVFYGQGGWEGLAPYRTTDGAEVLVDLGATDEHGLVPKPVPELQGVIRMHNQGRGYFDNANSPEGNAWFWWDLSAMQKAAGMKEGSPPIILQALANESGFQPSPPTVELRNNHLGYAITWFGLALALAGVATAFMLKKPDA
jgi:surfeit locus 1 family protein